MASASCLCPASDAAAGIHELGSLINYKLVLQRTVYFSFFNLLAHNFSKQKSKKKFKGLDSTFTVEVRERERERERVYSLKVSYIRLFTDITFCRAVRTRSAIEN